MDDQGFEQLLVDAICGVGFPSTLVAVESEKVGLARFIGNQWNECWEWIPERLIRCKIEQLQALYQGLCEARNEASVMTEGNTDAS